MPEGHTIHRLAERHRKLFAGHAVAVTSPQGRFDAGARRVDGRVFEDASAHGKHLFHHYAGGGTVHVHLGLYGRFTDGDGPPPAPVGEVRMRVVVDGGPWLDLRGPAACEPLDPAQLDALHARLGPDPLDDDSDSGAPYRMIQKSGRPLMALLMDQSVVAGAGLIYVTEALFRAGLPPTTAGRRLTRQQWQAIWEDLRTLMRAGVAAGRIDTVHSAHTPEAMGRAPRVDRHGGEVYVYRRAGRPCLVCGSCVLTKVLGARNAYWCPTCQKAR